MEITDMHSYYTKKERGKLRKLKQLLNYIDEFIPFEETDSKYEHFHVPCSDSFINNPKTSRKIKIAFLKKWIATTEKFIEQSRDINLPFCKIVAMISEQDFWGSEIIIFYDKSNYDEFFNRNEWTQIDNQTSFAKRYGIDTHMTEVLVNNKYFEDYNGRSYNEFLWFYNTE